MRFCFRIQFLKVVGVALLVWMSHAGPKSVAAAEASANGAPLLATVAPWQEPGGGASKEEVGEPNAMLNEVYFDRDGNPVDLTDVIRHKQVGRYMCARVMELRAQ